MPDALKKALDAVPLELLPMLGELVELILSAPDKRAAIERARFYAAADAAKLAADAALRKELG